MSKTKLSHKLYYKIKPFLPRNIRVSVRRAFALRKWERSKDSWPIDPDGVRPPKDWKGWPENKKFSFIITHDVEGIEGLEKVARLTRLEKEMGFRSSFNFVPEGEYRVSENTRSKLIADGFEVGVHDLNHDGKLFHSHSVFQKKALQINKYIEEWNAKGYRSGFMFRNLEWMHDLNISYDASTFDTDPFEPQPEGVHTIFPFWISNNSRQESALQPSQDSTQHSSKAGYVELPYTLVQDSTLFLLLKQKDCNIWKQKIDWIAKHGGMALINVHPDYICFENNTHNDSLYPVNLYKEFLQYIKTNYKNEYWHTLPKNVAEFYRNSFQPDLT